MRAETAFAPAPPAFIFATLTDLGGGWCIVGMTRPLGGRRLRSGRRLWSGRRLRSRWRNGKCGARAILHPLLAAAYRLQYTDGIVVEYAGRGQLLLHLKLLDCMLRVWSHDAVLRHPGSKQLCQAILRPSHHR